MMFKDISKQFLTAFCTLLAAAGFTFVYTPANAHASALVTNQSQVEHKRTLFGLNPTRSPHGSVQPQVRPNTLHKGNSASRVDLTLFVQETYQDLLLRNPTTAEVAGWVDALLSRTTSKAEIAIQLVNNTEFADQIAPVVRQYQTYLGPVDHPVDLLYWLDLHKLGLDLDTISASMAEIEQSTRQYKATSNRDFVISVYQALFGRHPEPDGLEFWKNLLDSGKLTRSQLMANLSESDEYQQQSPRSLQLTMITIGLLRRAPDQRELDFWLNNVDSKAELGFVNKLLVSDEYRSRFNRA